MYSLGVVLMELGMWKPLRHMKGLRKVSDTEKDTFDPRKLQEKLIEEARDNLAGEMGSRYSDAVLCCLQDTFQKSIKERQMREIFYKRVLQQLKEIVV
jgi:hypothetical protein